MKGKTAVLSAAALLAAGLGADFAEAGPGHRHHPRHHYHHHRPHIVSRVVLFAPVYAVPRYVYPAPVYYSPPPAPPVYIEQPRPQAYWYYCPDYQAYYPHVQNCPIAWQRVVPQPPPG